MYTRCFERGCITDDYYEVINMSDYGFEWYVNNQLVKNGLVEDPRDTVEMILAEGFIEVG